MSPMLVSAQPLIFGHTLILTISSCSTVFWRAGVAGPHFDILSATTTEHATLGNNTAIFAVVSVSGTASTLKAFAADAAKERSRADKLLRKVDKATCIEV